MPTATTRNVFDFVNGTDGKPVKGVTVNCVLNFNGASVTSPIVNIGPIQQSTITDGTGKWLFALVPNDTLTPSGTLYTIQTPFNTYDISVPSGGADVQSSTILANVPSVLSPAVTGLTGPITVTGNETVTGNLTVSGTTTLGSTTTTALTTAAQTVGGDLTISSAFRLLFGAAAAKIIPGATSISHRNNADNADNLLITDAGAATVRNGFTLTAGDAVLTAGRLLVSAAAAKILGGVTSLSLRNNADTADNVLVTDAGAVTLRNALNIPPSAGGTLATASYGTVPVKIAETTVGVATASITFSAIPAGFRHLLLINSSGRSDGAASVFFAARANGDTGTNYAWLVESTDSTGLAWTIAANVATASAVRIGTLANNSNAVFFSESHALIFDYTQTARRIGVSARSARDDGVIRDDLITGDWKPAVLAVITSLTLLPETGNIGSGLFELWGIP